MRTVLTLTLSLIAVLTLAQESTTPAEHDADFDLSEVFSKQFVLPSNYVMNSFSFELHFTVYNNNKPLITQTAFTSPISKQTNGSSRHSEVVEYLKTTVNEWLDAHSDLLTRLSSSYEITDSLPLVAQVYYSPIFYAQTGDTLRCDGERKNIGLAHGEEAATYFRFYVYNNTPTPYYAVARRNNSKVTLRYYHADNQKLLCIESYQIQDIDKLIRTGQQSFMADDGKKIRIRQTWNADTLCSAVAYDTLSTPIANYQFVYYLGNVQPHLKQKDIFNSSGDLIMRIEYGRQEDDIQYFNPDGSKAKYIPSPNAKKMLTQYVKKNFHAPKIGIEASKFNYIVLMLDVPCFIDKSGQLTITLSPNTSWTCGYNRHTTTESDIHKIVHDYYESYITQFKQELQQQAFECTPSLFNGEPIDCNMMIHIEHEFLPM